MGLGHGIPGREDQRSKGMGKPQDPCGPLRSKVDKVHLSQCLFAFYDFLVKNYIQLINVLKVGKMLTFVFISVTSLKHFKLCDPSL